MPLQGKKLGLLVSVPAEHPNFARALKLAETALSAGVDVYLYCIDEAVKSLDDPRLAKLRAAQLKIYACAYGAQRRSIAMSEKAVFAGLTVVNDLMVGTDRFVSFN